MFFAESATVEATTTTAAAEAATAVKTSAAAAAAAMAAAHFNGKTLGDVFGRLCGARIDQRQRLRALATRRTQQQDRGSREAEATGKPVPGILNLHHL